MKKTLPYEILRKIVWGFSIALSGLVLLLNLIYTAEVSYDANEKVTIQTSVFFSVIILVIIAVMFVLLCYAKFPFHKLSEKKLFAVLSAIYTVGAIYLILNVDPIIRADAKTVSDVALHMLEGNYVDFAPGEYIYRYPHQLGIAVFDSILYRFTKNIMVSFVVNFLFVLGINYFTYKISDHIFKSKAVNITTIFFSFAFLPQFFFLLFAYGLIPGFFFLTMAFYNGLKYAKDYKVRNLVFVVLACSVAVCLKKNNLIGILAILIYITLNAVKNFSPKQIAAICALILCIFLPTKIMETYYESRSDSSLNEGSPSILWAVMGTNIDNNVRGPGWYDNTNHIVFTESGFDSKLAAEMGKQRLSENLEKIKEDPGRAFLFFKDKTVSQWCEPMYGSVWSGPLEQCGQNTNTPLLKSLYNGKAAEDSVASLMKAINLVLWSFALLFLIKHSKNTDGWELFFMFFMGGLLFHTVWEGKSQYIYPYVFCLIPFASFAMVKTKNWLSNFLTAKFPFFK